MSGTSLQMLGVLVLLVAIAYWILTTRESLPFVGASLSLLALGFVQRAREDLN